MNKYVFVVAAIAVCSAQAKGEQTISTNLPAIQTTLNRPPGGDFWKDEIGSGFCKGTTELGASAQYVVGAKIFGTSQTHNLVLGSVRYGKVLSDVVGENTCWAGNWEVLGELFGGTQIEPRNTSLVALDGFIRYDFATGTRFIPFFQGGVGVMYTDIGYPDLGSDFEFNEKAGIGLHYFFTPRFAITVEARFMHISNAGISKHNLGVNTVPVSIGLSYFF